GIDSIDARRQHPSFLGKYLLYFGKMPQQNAGGVMKEVSRLAFGKWGSRRDIQNFMAIHFFTQSQNMGISRIPHIDSSIKPIYGQQIVRLGKVPGNPKAEARQTIIIGINLAQAFCRDLCDIINIPKLRQQILGDPDGPFR
ncbi:MAG: hypothetical protein WAU81_10045, partial [Candidatus Aminicenantales bacterium]